MDLCEDDPAFAGGDFECVIDLWGELMSQWLMYFPILNATKLELNWTLEHQISQQGLTRWAPTGYQWGYSLLSRVKTPLTHLFSSIYIAIISLHL